MFALGCLKIIKGLKCTGECKVLDLENNHSKTKEIRQMMKLSGLKSRRTATEDLRNVGMRLLGQRQGDRLSAGFEGLSRLELGKLEGGVGENALQVYPQGNCFVFSKGEKREVQF